MFLGNRREHEFHWWSSVPARAAAAAIWPGPHYDTGDPRQRRSYRLEACIIYRARERERDAARAAAAAAAAAGQSGSCSRDVLPVEQPAADEAVPSAGEGAGPPVDAVDSEDEEDEDEDEDAAWYGEKMMDSDSEDEGGPNFGGRGPGKLCSLAIRGHHDLEHLDGYRVNVTWSTRVYRCGWSKCGRDMGWEGETMSVEIVDDRYDPSMGDRSFDIPANCVDLDSRPASQARPCACCLCNPDRWCVEQWEAWEVEAKAEEEEAAAKQKQAKAEKREAKKKRKREAVAKENEAPEEAAGASKKKKMRFDSVEAGGDGYACPLCAECFDTPALMLAHSKDVCGLSGERTVDADGCSGCTWQSCPWSCSVVLRHAHLARHEAAHVKGPRPKGFVCPGCKSAFGKDADAMRACKCGAELCNKTCYYAECGMSCSTPSAQKKHESVRVRPPRPDPHALLTLSLAPRPQTHTGKYAFHCANPACNKGFASKRFLDAHYASSRFKDCTAPGDEEDE